jgi:hypothetical protein
MYRSNLVIALAAKLRQPRTQQTMPRCVGPGWCLSGFREALAHVGEVAVQAGRLRHRSGCRCLPGGTRAFAGFATGSNRPPTPQRIGGETARRCSPTAPPPAGRQSVDDCVPRPDAQSVATDRSPWIAKMERLHFWQRRLTVAAGAHSVGRRSVPVLAISLRDRRREGAATPGRTTPAGSCRRRADRCPGRTGG